MDEALQNYGEALAEIPMEHPDMEELLAMAQQRLPEDQRDAMMDHLAMCRDCGDVVLALREEEEQQQRWQHFREIPGGRAQPDATVPDERATPADLPAQTVSLGRLRRERWMMLVAALLLAGLLQWFPFQRDVVAPSLQPVSATLSLQPLEQGLTFRSGDGTQPAAMPAASARVALILNDPGVPEVAEYFVVFKSLESVSWVGVGDVSRQEEGFFLLIVEAGALSPGQYQVLLKDANATQEHVLATYALAVPPETK